ncbi:MULTISPECIES: chorismate mutase [Actinomyces]|uniref:Chorismate mutase n=1 Tax=Actinomyces respiraculi TaxID=2744574 RepID=A0A7T0LM52_9ACTO|nr:MULTISPECIES: chorismate mutase [Actinomyces]QPL06167.1 chorismate mutase [Actinomyces respiraculi]
MSTQAAGHANPQEPRPTHGAERVEASAESVPPQLAAYRTTIDNLDAALVHLLAERFRCTQQVGLLKAELDLPPSDPAREERQVRRLRALAEDSGLDPVFAEKFFAFIVAEVIRHHEAIRDAHTPA